MKNNKDLMLYIHIPFCVRKCNYCDFLSFAATKKEYKEYCDALISEINTKSKDYSDYIVQSIFIGGGTPSILDSNLIEPVLDAISKAFHISPGAEYTIECNPGTVDEDKLICYKNKGINRLSFGLQSCNDDELKMLGRIHDYKTFLDSYNLSRNLGFDNINVDIISAIPGQTVDGLKNTLEKVIGLNPEHISVYSLIIEEETLFYEMELALPSEDDERIMYELTGALLSDNSYTRYEISNYSKQGYECKHNLGYWERRDYLGLGLGASSLINNIRWKNSSDIRSYIKGDFARYEEEILDINECMSEFIFLGLRKIAGISDLEFYNLFSKHIEDAYKDWTEKMIKEKLLIKDGDVYYLSKRGLDLANYVMSGYV